MGDNEALKQAKNELRAVLLAKKNGISIARLLWEFQDLTCEQLDFRKFGSSSLEDFLRNKCYDVCRFGYDPKNPGIARVIAVANEDTIHIAELQRNTRPAKRSPPVRRRFPIPNPAMMFGYQPIQRRAYDTSDNRWSSSRSGGCGRGFPSQNNRTRPSNQGRDGVPPARQARSNQAPGFNQSRPAASQSGSQDSMLRSVLSPRGQSMGQSRPVTSSSRPAASASRPTASSNQPQPATKKSMKVTRSSWNIYGGYLLSILQKKKFGALKKDLERDYEEKFKESLPDNWVNELEGRYIMIANNFGDDILLVKAQPQEQIDRTNEEIRSEMESMDNEIYASASEMNASPSASDMNEEMPHNPATENRLEWDERETCSVSAVKAEVSSRISAIELEGLEENARLYESRTRYTGPQLTPRTALRRPQLYTLSDLTETTLGLNNTQQDQRVPDLHRADYEIKGEKSKDSRQDSERDSTLTENLPTRDERFSRESEEIFWSDGDSDASGDQEWQVSGGDLTLEDKPIFYKSSESSVDCICHRPKTLVFCSFCCYSINEARVKAPCKMHPDRYLPCDLLVCPQCISEYIVELKETVYY